MEKVKYVGERVNRQYNKKCGVCKISITGDRGIVLDITTILDRHVDGWSGKYDSIKLTKEERYYVTKCPSNETCWNYIVKDRELENIGMGVFGMKSQAEKYCKFLNER
jgi:hypothetical protein